MEILKQFLQDESMKPSFTRLIGAILCIGGFILLCLKMESQATPALSSGVALVLGGQAKSAYIKGSMVPKTVPKKDE